MRIWAAKRLGSRCDEEGAVRLYEKLGFETIRQQMLHRFGWVHALTGRVPAGRSEKRQDADEHCEEDAEGYLPGNYVALLPAGELTALEVHFNIASGESIPWPDQARACSDWTATGSTGVAGSNTETSDVYGDDTSSCGSSFRLYCLQTP